METKALQISNGLDAEEVEIVGINAICRLCGTQNDRLIGIFSEEGISNDIATKINLYLPIKVATNDDLPLQCCWNCASTILAWHELVITSVEIDRKFRTSHILNDKVLIDEDEIGYENPNTQSDDNDACDNKGSVSIPTSLEDFSKPKKKKKTPHLPSLQDNSQLDSYITDIEQHFIVPDLNDHSDYKIDIEQGPSLDTIEDQTKTDEEERPYYSCQFCSEIFFSEKAIALHAKEEHSEKFEVLTKPLNPAIEENIRKETRKHYKIDQEAISAAKVVVDGRIYFNCKECGKNLHSPYTYTWHMRIHTGERPYVCDLCGKQFRVSQGLIRHLRETHEGIKKFPCDLCGRMFATRRNVEEHRRIHTNERPYVCDLCGKSFKQKASLFVHKRSHRNHFPFKCSYCNQGFRTKTPLLVHITRHTGEKPYKCDVCGRCFRIKYELKRHRLIHSDEKPFVCNVCGFSFRQKRYLRNHIKSNHAMAD